MLVVVAVACGQSFEVASIRPSEPVGTGRFRFGMTGGPGTRDPGRFTCNSCNLSMLVTAAFDIKNFQLSGPNSLNTERFDVTATIAEGATKEQFRMMLQNLLAERFKMTVHHEKKEMPVYELVVAKGGPKLKETVEDPASKDSAVSPAPLEARGRGGPPPGNGATMTFRFGAAGSSTYSAKGQTMEQFAVMLSNQVGKPVTDGTGLKGKYDYTLTFAADVAGMMAKQGIVLPPPQPGGISPPADADSGPTIFAAVQELGLKLEQKKGLVDVVVVDHIEKVPTEN
jgi:uncharacterized protein (TIGR03435 family)